MEKSQKPNIEFSIIRIETTQFAIINEEINEEKLSVESNIQFGIDMDNTILKTSFIYSLLSENSPVLKIEAAVLFLIEPECFKKHLEKENSWLIPREFAIHTAITAVGVTRGILHEKTKNHKLNRFPIPTINVMDAVVSDIEILKTPTI